jgi:murein DD-endopeptidase MepM/ murein hydrolase activator NlpD
MRTRAWFLVLLPVLVAGPRPTEARTARAARAVRSGEPAAGAPRPPGPAWAPAASTGALARLVTGELVSRLGSEPRPATCSLDPIRAPLDWARALPRLWLDGPLATWQQLVANTSTCELTADPTEASALAWRLELRDLAAGPRALLGFAGALPDLSILDTSPVPGVESSGFGWRSDPIHHQAKFHKGTDFRAPHGTPVYAAGAGRVVFTGQQRGYGNIVYVDHGGGVMTRYAHLQRFEVTTGTLVPAGRLIARVGATGRATGPHLHFEVRLGTRAVEPSLAMTIGALQRTDPAAALAMAPQLADDVQARKIDRHDPPGRVRKAKKGHRGNRPERRGAPRRVRTVS